MLVEGDTFVNNLASYDSFSPGALFKEGQLEPFSLTLDEFDVVYDLANRANIGQPLISLLRCQPILARRKQQAIFE